MSDALPNEMWAYIFECIPSPADKLRVIQTCSRFYTLGIWSLYRTLQWSDNQHIEHNLQFWETHTEMTDVPRVLSISHYAGIGESEDMNASAHNLCKLMAPQISAFRMLEELVFFNSTLSGPVYATICELPRLNRLSIEYCTLPPLPRRDTHKEFSSLPITELTLRCFKIHFDVSTLDDLISPFYLATASNLRILRLGWTRPSARFFSQRDSALNLEHQLSPSLEELEIRMPYAKFWPVQENVSTVMFTNPLSSFLTNCPSITRLSFINHLPFLNLPHSALPNLRSYSGPLSTLPTFLPDRPLEHVEMTDPIRYHEPFTSTLKGLAKVRPQLKSLSVLLPHWEDEVMYVISETFPNLGKLQIRYVVQNPSEYTLLSMGHRFLYRLPELHTVQIYKPMLLRENEGTFGHEHQYLDRDIHVMYDTDLGPGGGTDEDVKDLILAWGKPCPNLREVQFVHGYVWKKCYDNSGWTKGVSNSIGRSITERMEKTWGMVV